MSNPIDKVRERLDGGRLWVGHGPIPESITFCLLTAVESPDLVPISETMGRVAREQFPDRVEARFTDVAAVVQFNDHPDTTWRDVELVLDKASVLWDEAHS